MLVSPEEFEDREDIGFESRIGDEVIQHGRTSQLIFPIDVLVEHVSATCPLLPGDLIFTGTPGGVGNRRTPPRFLQPGEVLTGDPAGRLGRAGLGGLAWIDAFQNAAAVNQGGVAGIAIEGAGLPAPGSLDPGCGVQLLAEHP